MSSASSVHPRRYLAVWFPWLPSDRLQRQEQRDDAPPEDAPPVVLAEKIKGALRLAAVDPAAARAGLAPGLPLADAQARTSALRVVAHRPDLDEALLMGVLEDFGLAGKIKLVLITNGSQLDRPAIQNALERMSTLNGEVWFKLDRATVSGVEAINNVRLSPRRSRAALLKCAELAPTWIQTCWFALDGKEADEAEQLAYLEWLASVREKIRGVHLYGVARPSLQAAAPRLSRLPVECFERFAGRIAALGIPVLVNP